MSVLTVRNLDPHVKTCLRVMAAQQGIAMEEAVRRILTRAVREDPAAAELPADLGLKIQARFAGLGEWPQTPRQAPRTPPFPDESPTL
jgi:plasmid stability protein